MFSRTNPHGSAAVRQFDPRAKGLAYLLLSGLVLATTRLFELLVLFALLLVLIGWQRLAARWLRMGRGLLPTLLLFVAVVFLGNGATAAISAALRLLVLTSAAVLFFATTPPEELGEALQASGLSPAVAFMFEGTVRFVPTMGRLVHEVRNAQASRGIRFDGLYLLRNGPALLAPTLVQALQLGDSLAEALEARGFGSPQRTLLRDYRFGVRDWLLVGSIGIVTTVRIACWIAH